MVKAPSVAPAGGPAGVRRIHPGPEIAMNPRNLPTASASMPPAMRGDANAVGRTTPVYYPQVDVSTQVDLHSGFGGPGGVMDSWDRRATPLYSREDIKEQYCITSRQLDAVEKSGGGFFGCLSTRGPSPCSSTRNSILSACVRSVPSDENLCDAPYPRRPLQIMYRQPYPTYSRGLSRYDLEDEADWIESSYFRRRPRSFCTVPDPKRYTWVPEDEESMKLEGPRPVLPPVVPPPLASMTTMQISQVPKAKHVSFARSHTLTSFEVPRNISPPRPHNPERLIDSQPTMQNTILPSSLPLAHPYPGVEPRVLVLEKQPKRGAMKTQATQTELPPMFRGRILPVTLSPRTIHRVKMVSQGAQTNGVFNGRKLTKSYSEAGQLGTPLGGQAGAPAKEETEHEPLHRTQSEEPPRSPFLISTTPPPIRSITTTVVVEETLPNGDIAIVPIGVCNQHRKSLDIDDQEIFINFKPAPVSPDARALLSRISEPSRRFLPLQKTFSDGEIRVERRELIGESSEPSYPHTCRRNQQDSWGRTVRTPVQFSSTPEDLSLLRSLSPHEDHHEEEFHENLIRRGLFRKRSVSLEDGVQGLSSDDFMLPRSLPTSPTSPTAAATTRRISQTPKDDSLPTCALLHAAVYPPAFSTGTGVAGTSIVGQVTSPFASSDSLTNDVTRDHSDGIWNESQATVLQADSLALLTPSSRRRHLLLLQHQQRSSMDTEALDVEDEVEPCPPSPRIRLEPATPVQPLTPRRSYRIQDLLPVQFQQIYYNDVSTAAHFYAYDIIESSISASNSRPRSGLRRASPGPPLSQPQSQSSSEFGLSLARTDSGGRTNTDISETSEDYVTANTSTETGTTTGTSATTSSWSRPPQTSSAAASAPASTTATAAEGSSFESASSIYSLARSEAVIEEPCSPPPILEEAEIAFGLELPPPAMRSSSSSSSGSYDLKDAMTDLNNDLEQVAPRSGHTSETELDRDEGHRSSSGGYAESPPDVRMWSEEERRRKKKTFSLDFLGGTSSNVELEHSAEPVYPENVEVSPTPSHRHRSRSKPTSARSPHRNNRKRDSVQQSTQMQQQQVLRSPQKEEWRIEQAEDGPHAPTSDDSSCSHHYHMHHHHHHHMHREGAENARHRRTRESPRRKTSGYISTRRRSNEDKNAAITGSLPRRKSRVADDIVCSSRLSPGRYQRSPGHNGQRALVIEAQSPEARLKALSAESLRSVSPGSDSVFYSESADQPCISVAALDAAHCHHCGREVPEEIVRPPAGFADSPEGHRTSSKHVTGHRLYKKFDKRYRSEDRGDRRHRRSSAGRSDIRAKSEERATPRPGSRGSIDDMGRRRLQARSTDASMEILTGREDEDTYVEPYLSSEWIYIGDLEESHVWKRPDSRDGDDEDSIHKERRDSQESTESEKNFKKRYQAATHRMVHRKSSGEMYKRIQTKCFESDKRVVVKREAGGEFGFRIHGSKPVVVSAIEPDTPAESSGLEVGDIIMSVNGRSVMDATHSEVVRLAHSGTDVLELEVARTCNVLAPRVARTGAKESVEEAPLYSGYLWRKSTSSSTEKWVRRWFALRRDNCLYCYKTDADSQPVGAVMLLKYDVEQTPELRVHGFAIKKKGAPTLRLAADTEEAAARWITVIREAVERNNQIDTWLDSSLRMREMAACAIQRPDCFGYLNKQQEHARKTSSPTGWSRRYCVLKDAALYFYDDANADKAFGVACLHGFRVHSSAPSSGGRKHAFELQPPDPTQRSYIFASESEMDKKRWLAALEYSIDRWIKIG
ncbi:PREDICTED: uncharacterized protein LOC108767362 isoform X1 [Trachymyrmex cornetzi]|uniref:uncharacterized protein LOC108767362 isoform X1 n=1 Tax=Trachymyrmex cornetzi TaxID=471704 RepID=UPI00084EE33C|nr:PREDICTED: uncharacterized protein LOC108767362 isoform X1 [Trachymyrmex cornetzi]